MTVPLSTAPAALRRAAGGSAVLLILLPVLGCGETSPGPGAPASEVPGAAEALPADTVIDEDNSGLQEGTRLLIESRAKWDSFHREVHRIREPRPRPPAVDFEENVVVAAGMGRRPTGGYSIAVEGVYRLRDTLYAEVLETSPGAGCMLTQALTAPVQAVRVPVSGLRALVTVERERERDCF